MRLSVRYAEDMLSDPCNRDGFPRPFVVGRQEQLWHFIAPEYATRLIANKTLYLAHFNEFDDKLEGALPVRTIKYWEEEARLNGWPASDAPRLLAELSERRERSFASCWRADESLWKEGFRRYARSPNEPKVCIETVAGAIGELIEKAVDDIPDSDGSAFGLGHVWYIDHINGQTPTNNGLFHLMMKNEANYAWEREVRILGYSAQLNGDYFVRDSENRVVGLTLKFRSLDWIRTVHIPDTRDSDLMTRLLAVCTECAIPVARVAM